MNKRVEIALRRSQIDSIPKRMAGVYAFWCSSKGNCVYVGKTVDLRGRLMKHWQGSHNEKLGRWLRAFARHTHICYLPADRGKIRRMERILIRIWNPHANHQHKRR